MFNALLLYTALGAAIAAEARPDVPTWEWPEGVSRRYLAETEVVVPQYLLFMSWQSKQARVSAFQIRAVLDCTGAEPVGRSWRVICRFEDLSLQAAALPGDRTEPGRPPLLQPVLEEMDERLTASRLAFTLRPDGRITEIDLLDLDRRNRRVGQMNETLRTLLVRVIAGFEFPLPRRGEDIWAQHRSMLLSTPAQGGTIGSSEIVHRIRSRDGGVWDVETVGKGLLSPFEIGRAHV